MNSMAKSSLPGAQMSNKTQHFCLKAKGTKLSQSLQYSGLINNDTKWQSKQLLKGGNNGMSSSTIHRPLSKPPLCAKENYDALPNWTLFRKAKTLLLIAIGNMGVQKAKLSIVTYPCQLKPCKRTLRNRTRYWEIVKQEVPIGSMSSRQYLCTLCRLHYTSTRDGKGK
jgi:hypothetical protein